MPRTEQAVLYVSYDGILEPLGQSQVLRYLERLVVNRTIVLISFEKEQDWHQVEQREAMRAHVRGCGVVWIPLRYHKRPTAPATAFDITQGTLVGSWAVLRYGIRIVHARSYVASVIALNLKKAFGLKYIFDMRAFWPDERVDGGMWPADGALYRSAKWFERRFLLSADCVVSLTQAAVDEMRTFSYLREHPPWFEVITTCTDLDQFRPAETSAPETVEHCEFRVGYVGTARGWYLFDETLRCFQLIRARVPNALLHILNRGDHEYISERIAAHHIATESVVLEATDHAGVARAMQRMDMSLFFIKPVYSKTGSAPTKLGELLGCGVPCLGNTGVGDMAAILEDEGVGVALTTFDDASMIAGIERMLALAGRTDIKQRCRDVALRRFSLEAGVRSYERIYSQLSKGQR